jgi:FkbM family methyltransferase
MNFSHHQKILIRAAFGLPISEWGNFFLENYRNKLVVGCKKTSGQICFHPKKLGGKGIVIRKGSSDISVFTDLLVFERYLPESLNQPLVIFDLGANIGCSTAHFASLFPRAKIIAVELEEQNYKLALENTAKFGSQIELIHGGVWNTSGRVRFGGTSNDGFSIDKNPKNENEANTYTVDQLIGGHGFASLDYVKMDIEGAENEVLLECEPTWLEKVGTISVEIHKDALKQKIFQRLASYGFQVRDSSRHWCGLTATRNLDAGTTPQH